MAGLLDLLTGGLLGGQAPQQQQQPQGLFSGAGDPSTAAFRNFAGGGNLVDRLLNAGLGATTGQRTDPVGMYQQMAGLTYNALVQAGVPEPQARLGAINPEVQKAITAKMFPTYEYKTVGNTGLSFNPATGQMMPQYIAPEFKTINPGDTGISYQPPLMGAAPGPMGIPRPQPIQGTPLAPPPGGQQAVEPPVPGGPGPSGSPAPVGGTQVIASGKSIAEVEAEKARGKVQGETLAKLPTLQQNTAQALDTLTQLQDHPGRAGYFAKPGKQGVLSPVGKYGELPTLPGTEPRNFDVLLNQAKSGIFRVAIQDMRGLGALSNVEGSKVEAALGRLDRSQTPEAFTQALNELKNYYRLALQNAQKIARGEMQPYPVVQQGGSGSGGSTIPQTPQPTPQAKVAPADRFQQLISSGKSKTDAYRQMHQEGY